MALLGTKKLHAKAAAGERASLDLLAETPKLPGVSLEGSVG